MFGDRGVSRASQVTALQDNVWSVLVGGLGNVFRSVAVVWQCGGDVAVVC